MESSGTGSRSPLLCVWLRVMPFSHVAPSYQPEQLAKLTEAFNQAWPPVSFNHRADNPVQLEWLRKRLANYILACASKGEFDPDKLTEHALRALIKRDTTASIARQTADKGRQVLSGPA
jgi:hypothetical protein